MALSWVIAGGGTGGHVTPALALAEQISARGDRVLLVGSERGLETRLVPEAGYELVALPSQQVMGRSLLGRVRGVFGILGAVTGARAELARVDADIVISVGGYASMPAVLAAALRRTPIAVIEPNAIPGRVNRLCARFAHRIFVGFDDTVERMAGSVDARRIRCPGIPLRSALVERLSERGPRRTPEAPFRLLVFGGSQGAHQINEAIVDALPRLVRELGSGSLEVFHQSGDADRAFVTDAYAKAGVRAQVVAFESDMPARYVWADVAISRAGAMTVGELSLVGLPALLVPYPYAADDHQGENAMALERAGAALRLDSRTLDADAIAAPLIELLNHPERLVSMGRAADALGRPDAARSIIEECERMLAEKPERP